MPRKLKSALQHAHYFARRIYASSPRYLVMRLWQAITKKWSDERLPRLAKKLNAHDVAMRLGFSDVSDIFDHATANAPFPIFHVPRLELVDRLNAKSKINIRSRAEQAMRREVEMLGSGPVQLGIPIDWHRDFKSNVAWPMTRLAMNEILDLNRPSDIKIPWELSRLQWLLPVAQAFMIFEEEKYAAFTRTVIEEWIDANPVCRGPNWVCAMDVAMRAMAICWIFLACRNSQAWQDEAFLERLLYELYLHALYTEQFIEWSDIAGNHLTTDLAGLVVIGLFLGDRKEAKAWTDKAWDMLLHEFPMQVPNDGVCREGSVPYHRLVGEVFPLPALARQAVGQDVPMSYWEKLKKMADFIDAYSRPDGTVPNWGDADDGRVLPLGSQPLNDHRYLSETIRSSCNPSPNPKFDETLWWLGPGTAACPKAAYSCSRHFIDSGAIIMRNDRDHIFIDAGPVGMAGRGGHGHNDCLSFEAIIGDNQVIVDPGTYVYSSDWRTRNRFRGTGAHNTPFIDGIEINEISREDWLWYLKNDAIPEIRELSFSDAEDVLTVAHTGYSKLASPVTPVRTIKLAKGRRQLEIHDDFEGSGVHQVQITYTFAPNLNVQQVESNCWRLRCENQTFLFSHHSLDNWSFELCDSEYSPSYGVLERTKSLVCIREGTLKPLNVQIVEV